MVYPLFSLGLERDRRGRRLYRPRIAKCGVIDVGLGLAELALARRATRIWGLLDRCLDGDVWVDESIQCWIVARNEVLYRELENRGGSLGSENTDSWDSECLG